MSLYYFDTSALVKYYVTEPGSVWVRALFDEYAPGSESPRHAILVAEITRVEVAAGLAAIERAGRIRQVERDREYRRFMSHWTHRLSIIPLVTDDVERASNLTQVYPLKAYDAIQLAVALRHNAILAAHDLALIFISGDKVLLAAARAEGLGADNPFDHA